MFVKLNLILICVFLFNGSKVNCDCNDFIECVGDLIGDVFASNKKNVAAKAVKVPDVISAVGDLLGDISRFIEDSFNVTKEISLTKNVENKTEIHVETFKINDGVIQNNKTSNDSDNQLSNTIESKREVNNTNNIVNNIFIDVKFELKENKTATIDVQKENESEYLHTETPIDFTNSDTVSTTDNSNYNNLKDVTDDTNYALIEDSIKNALSEEYLNNKAIIPEKSNEYTGYDNLNFTTNVVYNFNFTYGPPLNTTDTVLNKTFMENQNTSNIFINIPEAVAANYTITFETPINVTHFEINTSQNDNAATNTTKITVNTTNLTTKEESKNSIENQNVQENEIIALEYEFDDVIIEDNTTDYLAIDYIDLYKDTTNEDVDYTPTTYIPTSTEAIRSSVEVNETNGIYSVYPWIATVFIKNNDNNQFEYICDGVLLSDKVILTAARCVRKENMTEAVENILVILGKRSLQESGPNEKVLLVKAVKLHENFTAVEGKVDNDLAIIVLAEPIAFNEDIQPVPLKSDEVKAIETATTGWHVTGRLTPIYFDKESSKTCKKNTLALNTFCAVFGDDITTCPSYGGLYVARQTETEWNLQGLTAGNPTNRGACFHKDVTFTNISQYRQWIIDNIELNKV